MRTTCVSKSKEVNYTKAFRGSLWRILTSWLKSRLFPLSPPAFQSAELTMSSKPKKEKGS